MCSGNTIGRQDSRQWYSRGMPARVGQASISLVELLLDCGSQRVLVVEPPQIPLVVELIETEGLAQEASGEAEAVSAGVVQRGSALGFQLRHEIPIGHHGRPAEQPFQAREHAAAVDVHEGVIEAVVAELGVHESFLIGVDIVGVEITHERSAAGDVSPGQVTHQREGKQAKVDPTDDGHIEARSCVEVTGSSHTPDAMRRGETPNFGQP
jgi:hypothetical protein